MKWGKKELKETKIKKSKKEEWRTKKNQYSRGEPKRKSAENSLRRRTKKTRNTAMKMIDNYQTDKKLSKQSKGTSK